MEKETKVDIIHENVSKEDKDLKKLVTYLQNKQTEIFTKLKELETENLRLRYAVDNDEEAFKRYKNIDTVLPNVIFGKSAPRMPSESTAVKVYTDSFLSNRAFLYCRFGK